MSVPVDWFELKVSYDPDFPTLDTETTKRSGSQLRPLSKSTRVIAETGYFVLEVSTTQGFSDWVPFVCGSSSVVFRLPTIINLTLT